MPLEEPHLKRLNKMKEFFKDKTNMAPLIQLHEKEVEGIGRIEIEPGETTTYCKLCDSPASIFGNVTITEGFKTVLLNLSEIHDITEHTNEVIAEPEKYLGEDSEETLEYWEKIIDHLKQQG